MGTCFQSEGNVALSNPTVTELRLSSDKRCLAVVFDNGDRFEPSAQLLRVESPSAEVQGHDPSQKTIVPGKRDVAIAGIEPVGNYAVRLIFDDGHDTGIFSWEVLHRLGSQHGELLATYREKLTQGGLPE
ncbi:MAG: DUF971 domain-containing protein [Pseudomonadota bacterium]